MTASKACKESVLVVGDGGFPRWISAAAPVRFVPTAWVRVEHGALDPGLAQPWSLKAHVAESCLSMRGITCRACGDACTARRAIRFQLQTGARSPGRERVHLQRLWQLHRYVPDSGYPVGGGRMNEYHVCGVLLMSRPEHSARSSTPCRQSRGGIARQ